MNRLRALRNLHRTSEPYIWGIAAMILVPYFALWCAAEVKERDWIDAACAVADVVVWVWIFIVESHRIIDRRIINVTLRMLRQVRREMDGGS